MSLDNPDDTISSFTSSASWLRESSGSPAYLKESGAKFYAKMSSLFKNIILPPFFSISSDACFNFYYIIVFKPSKASESFNSCDCVNVEATPLVYLDSNYLIDLWVSWV